MIGIVDYGMGNLQSLKNACEFLGEKVLWLKEAKQFGEVSHLILPGVGAFGRGMENLHQLGIISELKRAILEKGIPTLGICLGMQLLADKGTEWGEYDGLGLIPGVVRRLDDSGVRLPHIGWNGVEVKKENSLISVSGESVDYYFVHSYFFDAGNQGDVIAISHYGQPFPSVISRKNIFGVQFHPEKSRKYGLDILENFFKISHFAPIAQLDRASDF